MASRKIVYISLLLLLVSDCILCLPCPALKPNANVHVFCKSLSKDRLSCNSNDDAEVGTIAAYKCDNYFKQTIRGRNGGTMDCTEEGKWSKYDTFRNFHCTFDCGRIPSYKNELISHGNSTEAKRWPWVATIFRRAKDGTFKYSCGGTLIGQKSVLTAAHCVANAHGTDTLPTNLLRVFLGTLSSSYLENANAGVQSSLVKEIHMHPDFQSDLLVADIAIIVLTEFVTLNESVFPICLPRSHEHERQVIRTGKLGEIASFGTDGTGRPAKTLQHAHIPIVTIDECHDVINIIPHGDQYCAGNTTGANICRGDSGSGMVFKSVEWNEEKYSVHGIISSTGELANGCAPLFVITKVYSYIIWIEEMFIPGENLGNIKGITGHVPRTRPKPAPGLYSRAERAALRKVYPMVKNILLEDYMHKDEYLIRFLRSKQLNLKETNNMLKTTMDWRKANYMNEILKENFTDLRNDFPTFSDSFDKDGRPVFVTLLRLWDYGELVYFTKLPKFFRYILRNYEETEERIRAVGKPNINQCFVINDYDGFERKKHLCGLCLRVTVSLMTIYENHYPQQFYLWYAINMPKLAVSALSVFLMPSEYLVSGVRIFGTNKSEWRQELLKKIPADQLFVGYGGTKVVKYGTKRRELAL